jgi:hypothetical protein
MGADFPRWGKSACSEPPNPHPHNNLDIMDYEMLAERGTYSQKNFTKK